MDAKKIPPVDAQWDHDLEREIFGNQHPYASGTSSAAYPPDPNNPAHTSAYMTPYLATPITKAPSPHQLHPIASPPQQQSFLAQEPFKPSSIPTEAPPMYTENPEAKPTAILTAMTAPPAQYIPPQQSLPPQQSPSSPIQSLPEGDPQMQGLLQQTQPQQPSQNATSILLPSSPAPVSSTPTLLSQEPYSHGTEQRQPTSYGAIRPQQARRSPKHKHNHGSRSRSDRESAYTSDSSDSEHDSWVRKKLAKKRSITKCSLGSCICLTVVFVVLICYYLVETTKFLTDPCAPGHWMEMKQEGYNLPVSPNQVLDIKILEGITGNVVVRESDSTESIRIMTVFFLFRGSTAEVLRNIELQVKVDRNSLFAFGVKMRSNDAEENKRLLKGRCAKADIEIVYPRATVSSGHLAIQATTGNFRIELGEGIAVLETMALSMTRGNIRMQGAIVRRSTDIRVEQGEVQGLLRTSEQVNIATTSGQIGLEVDTTPGLQGWNPENLNISMTSVNSPVRLDLTRWFHGHFSLRCKLNSVLGFSPASKETVVYTSTANGYMAGWISKDENEPEGMLPLVGVTSRESSTAIVVLDDKVQ